MKEPEYYGRARQVIESPTPTNNFQYLEYLSDKELDLTRERAHDQKNSSLEKVVDDRKRKRYIESIVKWLKEVDTKIPRIIDERIGYLKQCNRIIAQGWSNYQDDLIVFWSDIRKRADILVSNLRHDCHVRTEYETGKNGLMESLICYKSEMMKYE